MELEQEVLKALKDGRPMKPSDIADEIERVRRERDSSLSSRTGFFGGFFSLTIHRPWTAELWLALSSLEKQQLVARNYENQYHLPASG